jgi:hypothetical protein
VRKGSERLGRADGCYLSAEAAQPWMRSRPRRGPLRSPSQQEGEGQHLLFAPNVRVFCAETAVNGLVEP